MKVKLILLLILISSSLLFSYEFSLANLTAPSGLHQGEAEIAIIHRFYGDITEEPFDTMFGIDVGANIGFRARYQFYENIETVFNYQRRQKEKKIGLIYRFEFEDIPVKIQPEIHYFSYKESKQEDEYARNFEYLLAIQSDEIADNFVLTANIAYDSYLKRFNSGAGLTYTVLDNTFLFFEYYPVFDRNSASDRLKQYIKQDEAYLFGVFLQTYGHKFIFTISNSDNIGLRRTSIGVDDSSVLKFGFNIQRKF